MSFSTLDAHLEQERSGQGGELVVDERESARHRTVCSLSITPVENLLDDPLLQLGWNAVDGPARLRLGLRVGGHLFRAKQVE
jgi:hypothetical protein